MRNSLTCHQLIVYARICQTLCNWWQEVCQRWQCHYRAAVCSDKEINQRLLENRGNMRFCERSIHSVVSLLWARQSYSLLIGSEAPTDSFWYCWKKRKTQQRRIQLTWRLRSGTAIAKVWKVGCWRNLSRVHKLSNHCKRQPTMILKRRWLRRFLAQSLCTIGTDTVGQLARDLPLAQYIPEFP